MKTLDKMKEKFAELYFVPWEIGMIAKRWDELNAAEREIAVPASLVYSGEIKL